MGTTSKSKRRRPNRLGVARHAATKTTALLVSLLLIGISIPDELRAQTSGANTARPPRENFVNSLGMEFVPIGPGRFLMGQERGAGWERVKTLDRISAEAWLDSTTHTDWDEVPVHEVTISKPFLIGTTEVTNAQYEQFDPAHRRLRGKRGFSKEDDEAVVFVSWHEAAAFCGWLAKKEGKPYRLPTEAEWEYAARAGTTTPYSTGEHLPPEMIREQALKYGQEYTPVSLRVSRRPANPWGLLDVHGNVEEWINDWYGPYEAGPQTDPVGRASGMFRVARGGSHNTTAPFLRSANRMGTLPADRSALIGFRCVVGEMPSAKPLPATPLPLFMRNVSQQKHDWFAGRDGDEPRWMNPVPFVRPPESGFIGWHNHQPSITWAPNGDLLAVFFSTHRERSREMVIMGTRLRRGSQVWDAASQIFYAPDRNATGASVFHDGRGRLYLLGGLDEAQYWSKLAMVLRTSTDNGATWTTPNIISPEHQLRNQLIHGMIQTAENHLMQLADAVPGQDGGSAAWLSANNGATWTDLGATRPPPTFEDKTTGAWIAGIHARAVQLRSGSLMAIGRGDPIGDKQTMSISKDMGRTWAYQPSEFPAVRGGQRTVLRRLQEGPLLFVGFTDPVQAFGDPFNDGRVNEENQAYKITDRTLAGLRRAGVPESIINRIAIERREVIKTEQHARSLIKQHLGEADARKHGDVIVKHLEPLKPQGMIVRDAAGVERRVYGMFAALSFDEGRTWPVRKLLTPGGAPRVVDCYGWVQKCFIDDTHAEVGGYLADTQTPDGMIHLISSGLHYRFNLAWLKQLMPAADRGRGM